MMKQRERDIIRDIKFALKTDEIDTIKVLLAEYKALAPSRPDILYDVAHSLLAKDRPSAEKAFSYIAQRGSVGGTSGDLSYASALVQLSVFRYVGGAIQDAHKTLTVAARFISERREGDKGKHDSDFQEKLEILYDYTNHFMAMCCYRMGQWAEVLRRFDETSSYHLVLEPANYALITLVKSLAFLKLGNRTDALGALQRRQSQEEALEQVSLIGTSFTDSNTNSGSTTKNLRKASLSSVHLCHDLHIALLNATGQTDEAREYFKQFKQDYQRSDFDTFVELNNPLESIGSHLIDWWTPSFPDITKKRVEQRS